MTHVHDDTDPAESKGLTLNHTLVFLGTANHQTAYYTAQPMALASSRVLGAACQTMKIRTKGLCFNTSLQLFYNSKISKFALKEVIGSIYIKQATTVREM